MLPRVDSALSQTTNRVAGLESVLALLRELEPMKMDDEERGAVHHATTEIDRLRESQRSRVGALEALRTRFERDTVNIGVSGEARVGKSTTLQQFSGLSDTQIPTGKGLPVTAVRSMIFNSPDKHAEITFRDQASFIADYIAPLVDTINQVTSPQITIRSLAELRSVRLPDYLGNNVDSRTSNSLSSLKEAQASLETYERHLIGRESRVELEDLRRFVAYPTDDEIERAQADGKPAERAYLAVHEVKIYCEFPRLEEIKIGLVDLPGLGEIGDSVAATHLSGLEDGIDQVFLIMKPGDADGFVKSGIASNVDQLRRVQLGVRRRSDLIAAGVNVFTGRDELAQTLENDFRRKINDAQQDDAIDLVRFNATDAASVADLFDALLVRIGERLPRMDREAFEYALAEQETNDDVARTLDGLLHTMNQILKRIPLEDRWLNDQVKRISRRLKDEYNRYEVERDKGATNSGAWAESFKADVRRIHAETATALSDGFFLGKANWEYSAAGQTDYYVFYREEAKRLRREIIAKYGDLDDFYVDHVNGLKSDVLDIFFRNTGALSEAVGVKPTDDADARIEKLRDELSGSIRDPDLDAAFDLLKTVHFSFRHNVFLHIARHLESLANPGEDYPAGSPYAESIRMKLGGISDIDEKRDDLAKYLASIANEANDNIQNALNESEDKFGEYLAISISFFIDYLYRKDDDNFTNFVVRRLINVYRDQVLPQDSTVATDYPTTALVERIKLAIKKVTSGAQLEVVGASHARVAAAVRLESRELPDAQQAAAVRTELPPIPKPPTTRDLSFGSPKEAARTQKVGRAADVEVADVESAVVVNHEFRKRVTFRDGDSRN